MNGTVVNIIDYHAVDLGSIPDRSNFLFFVFFFVFVFFVSYFQFVSFFFFSFNGERSNYIISLTTEPPITLSNKQLQRNGVHANDFNMFLKKLQEVKKSPF